MTPVAGGGVTAVGGGYARVAPGAVGALVWGAGARRLELTLDGDYRFGAALGTLLLHRSELSLQQVVGRLRAHGGLVGALFSSSQVSADDYHALGPRVAGRLDLAAGWRVYADASLVRRWLPNAAARTDWLAQLSFESGWRPTLASELGLFGAAATAGVSVDQAVRDAASLRSRTGPYARTSLGRWLLGADAWAGVSNDALGGRRAVLGVDTTIRLWVGAAVDVSAAAGAARGAAGALDDRVYVAVSLVPHISARHEIEVAHTAAPSAQTVAGGVRFALGAHAREVRVLGEWNGWAAEGTPLELARDAETWEVVLPLRPGSYRYRFRVDGRSVRPPRASSYVRDDFGGEDGLVDVR